MGGCWVGALAAPASLPPQTNRPITYCLPLRRNTTLLSLSRLPLPQQSLVVLSENDRIVMCWPKHLLVNRDGALIECFCLGPLALCLLVHVGFADSLHKAVDATCGIV